MAAGLAGGSSDAAALLLAANRAWNLNWPVERLAELASRLGSDIPFFLAGVDRCRSVSAGEIRGSRHLAAIARGRGEKIEPLAALPTAWVVIVKPRAGLSTAEVYRNCRPAPGARSDRARQLHSALAQGNRRQVRLLMANRLEEAAERLSEWPARLRSEFARRDVELRQMSGSGSSYFGIARDARHARRVGRQLAAARLGEVFVTRM